MTDTQSSTLVLKDPTGNYFLVDMKTVEQGRVPAEQTTALEQLMTEQQDTQGYFGFGIGAAPGTLEKALRVVIVGPIPAIANPPKR